MTTDTLTRRESARRAEQLRRPRARPGGPWLLLTDVRALTLCGPGGIGKTRLALRLGGQLAADFPDGAWLVELADMSRPGAGAPPGGRHPGHPGRARPAADRDPGRRAARPAAAAHPGHLRAPRRRLRGPGPRAARRLPLAAGGGHQPGAAAGARRDGLAGPAAGAARPRWTRCRPSELAGHEAIRLFVDRAAAVRPGFALGRGQRARGRAAVPDAGRRPAGHRAGRGADPGPVGRADGRPDQRPVPAAGLRRPHRAGAPADAAGRGGLELRAADRARADPAAPAVGVLRLEPGDGRAGLRRRADPGRRGARPAGRADRQVAGQPRRRAGRGRALPAARHHRRVRRRPAGRLRRAGRDPGRAPRLPAAPGRGRGGARRSCAATRPGPSGSRCTCGSTSSGPTSAPPWPTA